MILSPVFIYSNDYFFNVGTIFSNSFCTLAFNDLSFLPCLLPLPFLPMELIPAYIQTTHAVATTRLSTRAAVF